MTGQGWCFSGVHIVHRLRRVLSATTCYHETRSLLLSRVRPAHAMNWPPLTFTVWPVT